MGLLIVLGLIAGLAAFFAIRPITRTYALHGDLKRSLAAGNRTFISLFCILAGPAVGGFMAFRLTLIFKPHAADGALALAVVLGTSTGAAIGIQTMRVARRTIAGWEGRARPGAGMPVCNGCGYILKGATTPFCPECGRVIELDVLRKARRQCAVCGRQLTGTEDRCPQCAPADDGQ